MAFLCIIVYNRLNMASQGNNFGKKGACLGQFILIVIILVILLLWVYQMNFKLSF